MAFTQKDTECMALALKLSKLGQGSVGANPMVGCVISSDDKIIAKDYHRQYGQEHAEINALNQIKHKADNCKLYVTLEPCPMCAGAAGWAQFGRIVYGANDDKNGFMIYGKRMLHPKTKVEFGISHQKCAELMTSFFLKRRN